MAFKFLPFVLIGIIYHVQNIQSNEITFYCSTKSTQNSINLLNYTKESLIRIVTRDEGASKYQPNKICQWRIEAAPNERIELYDFSIDLQYVPDYSTCYQTDYLEISNKAFSESPTAIICRNDGFKSIFSTGNELYLSFSSNHMVEATGIKLSVRSWKADSNCPTNWHQSTDGESCFSIYHPSSAETLEKSQGICNLAESNLASFDSLAQLNEVIDNYLSKQQAKSSVFWIGLNDIEQPDIFKWLDSTVMDFKVQIVDQNRGGQSNCFGLKLTHFPNNTHSYFLTRLQCDSKTLQLPFICRMPKTGIVSKYKFPRLPNIKDAKENYFNIFLKIGFPIIALAASLLAVLASVFYCKTNNKLSNNRKSKLMTLAIIVVLAIGFLAFFVFGILTRRNKIMMICIPVMVLLLLAIVVMLYRLIKNRDESSPRNQDELTNLNNQSDPPAYKDVVQ